MRQITALRSDYTYHKKIPAVDKESQTAGRFAVGRESVRRYILATV